MEDLTLPNYGQLQHMSYHMIVNHQLSGYIKPSESMLNDGFYKLNKIFEENHELNKLFNLFNLFQFEINEYNPISMIITPKYDESFIFNSAYFNNDYSVLPTFKKYNDMLTSSGVFLFDFDLNLEKINECKSKLQESFSPFVEYIQLHYPDFQLENAISFASINTWGYKL